MKLRTNLFLIIGGLLLTLLLIQWWVFTHLKHQLREEVSSTAFEVSRDTASAVILHQVKIRLESQNQKLKQQRLEWYQQHPGGTDSDVFIELKENLDSPVIELIGPGLNETIVVSQQGFEKRFTGLSSNLLYYIATLMVFAIILAAFFAHRLSKPLQNLVITAQQLGEGKLGKQISQNESSGPQEIQSAIKEFNAMSIKLEQLEAHNRQLQNSQQLSELGEIARGFAHSLRNPLNTLGLATNELADEELSAKKKQQLNQIVKRQIARIDHWIKSFMSLSQHGADLKNINIAVIIDELVLEMRMVKPDLSWQLKLDDTCEIEGYEQELRTILQVLLENAVEASEDSDIIEVLLQKLDDSCKITIVDQGTGIPDDIKDQLFVPKVTSKGSGAGMGLFIANRLVQSRYQGSLKLCNRDPKGVQVDLILSSKQTDEESTAASSEDKP